MNVSSGVPQGNVLGPVWFIIYINDMPDMLGKYCKMFADDAKLYSAIETTDDQEELQDDLFDYCDWGKDWLLEHNIKNVNTFNMEMSNMNTIIKRPIKMVISYQ